MAEKTPEIKSEEQPIKAPFETREGERFFAERLISPEDPRVEKVQEMLEGHFGKNEVDPIEAMKQAMIGKMETGEKCASYLIHVAENSKGEIKGVHTGAVVETVDARGDISEKFALSLGCYAVVSPEMRNQGIWENLFQTHEKTAKIDADRRGLEIKGFMTEAHNEIEPILNKQDVKRAYIKTKEGFRELPYEQPPLDWNARTGKPAKDAGIVPEHLMLKLSSGENRLSGKELMEMVRGMYYYNNYREEEYFKTGKAYKTHTEFVEGVEQKLADFIGKKQVRLLSRGERETMGDKGVKFIEHKTEESKPELKTKAEMKKEWKEYFGPLAEAQLEQEKIARRTRQAEKEKEAIKSAEIPQQGMKTSEILKEAGIQKPIESFNEAQERLAERLNRGRTLEGKKLSDSDKFVETRKFYLEELGYSVKYKGVLLDKAEILDENGKSILSDKGKSLEFKSFYFSKTEAQINNFLKERLQEKLEGKSAEKLTEEQKLEKGYQNTVKATENAQVTREAKISFLQETFQKTKKLGKETWGKLTEGIARLNLRENLSMGLYRSKELAIEGGKDLAVAGLTPLAAIEEAVKKIRIDAMVRERVFREGRIKQFEERPLFGEYTEFLRKESQQINEQWAKSHYSLFEKSKILKLIERIG